MAKGINLEGKEKFDYDMEFSLVTLTEWESQIGLMIEHTELLDAEVLEKMYACKRTIKKRESEVAASLYSRKVEGKRPTQGFVDIMVERDPTVGEAHYTYSRLEKAHRRLQARLSRLYTNKSLIPGMQGRLNEQLRGNG